MLSAVVITSNAKDTIGDCLDALLKVTTDVVVVDSGSNDGTRDICNSKNVRYYSKAWEGYAANKNYGNQLAQHNYILSIDSDEILTQKLIQSIKKEFSQDTLSDAYSIKRINNFCGKWIRYGGWNPDWAVRIFNKNKISWQMQEVHEVLNITREHKTKKLYGDILHYSYPTLSSHLKKIEKYTDLYADLAFKSGKTSGILKAYASSGFTFFSHYFLKLGFLDGYYGLVIAKNNSYYSFLKYKKLAKKIKIENT